MNIMTTYGKTGLVVKKVNSFRLNMSILFNINVNLKDNT